MALNAGSHNTTGEKTGPVTGPPPAPADHVKTALLEGAHNDGTGQHAGGQDGGNKDEPQKVKSEKELERERKKAEKDAKFKAKKAAQASASKDTAKGPAKEKKPKAEKEVLPEYVEETPKGEKKILKDLDDVFHKAYIPKVVESAWYDWWEQEGFFKPELKDGKVKEAGKFVIPIPPPNVTGKLHCGHALATALQDVLIRWHRMQGYTTLYVPGCDHAGISTQSVVENMLWRREKKTRYDLGRPKFLETTMEWKNEYHANINKVLKRLGGSFDWTREAFTMDANLSKAVTETFVRMHEEGLIYRSNRLVNWCTKLNTALSNLEVDNKELTGRTLLDVPGYERKVEFGVITHFKYPIDGTDEFIEVATTRVETMLGDSAIAVNPNDERYAHLVGKKARHPFIDRLMPIVADDYVDKDFGTGAVKITPAHDPNDFNLGKRHNLEFINILNDDGTLNQNVGEKFQGQKRFDARYTVTEELTKLGLFVKKEDNPMKVPLCNKSKDVIEPLMKPQWWMKMKSLAEPAIKAVRDGDIVISPATQEKVYFHWMENINDWCLSRQLWWGHQIPAYFVHIEGENGDRTENDLWVTGRTEEEAHKKAEAKFPGKKLSLSRDEDVLDTWFSSGLWPFSTLGWPNETEDLKNLFPTSVLETGWDILFFWVARMIMFSLHLTGKIPFKEVYCHSLIRDNEGRKMSKSLGNVIDPIDIMEGITLQQLNDKLKVGNLDPKEFKTAEKYQKTSFPQGIPECGADALRMALVGYTTGGGDISFDVSVIHGYRRFCNKIYQATKYVLGRLGDFTPRASIIKSGKESLPEKWILHKLAIASKLINERLKQREFSNATQVAYKYFYNFLCDVYIENSKAIFEDGTEEEKESAKQTLYTAIEGGLLMIHPFMPFLTEELWQRLPRREGDKTRSITVATYPQYIKEFDDETAEAEYELLVDTSQAIRSVTAEYGFKDGNVFVQPLDDTTHKVLTSPTSLPSLRSLGGKFNPLITILSPSDPAPTGCAVHSVGSQATVFLDIKGKIDIEKEIAKAKDRLAKANEAAEKQKKVMGIEGWEEKVSEAVKETERERLRAVELEARNWGASIGQFERLKIEN
ncbi:valyl-tRNA synthetase-like protein [Amniculicola lignicola CBS 123094]|uniref:Valine--tRNA ligase, mitochondrial n=1 Tax=Amniculicola lignicola CBS 123094 TaxID=1392246 RepID=A0A6A5W8B4_9PLEO|nr:valyl-tRNA synthetase-like protein [Amniculicola lignicola CBS 123094]